MAHHSPTEKSPWRCSDLNVMQILLRLIVVTTGPASHGGICTQALTTPTAKFFINCLAEPPEEVAQYLVPRIRKVPLEMRSIGGGIGQVGFS